MLFETESEISSSDMDDDSQAEGNTFDNCQETMDLQPKLRIFIDVLQ